MYVTRQSNYYDSGAYSVELASELNVSGPGALVSKYAGEFEEYDDPREAADVAIRIRKEWQKEEGLDYSTWPPQGVIPFTLQMNDMVYATVNDGLTAAGLRRWANEQYDKLPKCDRCGSIGATTWRDGWGEEVLACGEFCAEEMLAPDPLTEGDECSSH
jgi:hypothetical protein